MQTLLLIVLSSSRLLLTAHVPQLLPLFMVAVVVLVFLGVFLVNRIIRTRVRQRTEQTGFVTAMMQQALKISANNVIIYDLRSHWVNKLYGHMLPDEGVSEEEWKQHVHPDDLPQALDWLRLLMSGQVKSAEFYYRWNFDYSGGRPRWGYLHNTSVAETTAVGSRPISIISTLVDETQLRRQQKEESDLTGKYKLIFEQSIIGMSFYTPDGWLIDANKNMREICHFDSDDGDAFFSHVNLFDMSPFRECVDRQQVDDLWICSQSVVPERDMHDYLEIQLHPIRDDQGQLVYIAVAARNVSEERNLYLQTKLNDAQIRRANEEIQHYETELRYLMDNCEMQAWRIALDRDCIEFYSGLSTIVRTFTLAELRQIFVSQQDDFVRALDNPAKAVDHPLSYVGQMKPVVTLRKTEPQWVQINSIPEYDDHGRLLGSFGVWRNITALMSKQEQLRRETERANDSGHQKSVFLANMTHEIRTPLNAIVGFSDLLQAIDQPEEKREMIRIIHNNCDMLLRLINDILVLSNMDSNAMQLMPERVDFAREFADICQSLAQRVQEPGVEFQQDNPCQSLFIDIDNRRIQQVITNFVTNAVKYTHQGHIRVGYRVEEGVPTENGDASTENGELRTERYDNLARPESNHTSQFSALSSQLYVYCEDTGSGIPKEQQSAVFERFVKLNEFVQGTGLGLSICKAIIEKCGGQIGVDSEPGRGSTFWFRIPVTILPSA